jgi:hypothetical protein
VPIRIPLVLNCPPKIDAGSTFPVLSALPLSQSAHALALFAFVRAYSQTWGLTIGATILQNGLKRKLPSEFFEMFGSVARGAEISYTVIRTIPSLPEPLRTQVKVAFADSLRTIWFFMTALCIIGHEATDEDWGMKEPKRLEPRVRDKV